MSFIHFCGRVVEFELGVIFVDGVVGEVHEKVAEVFLLGLDIL